MKEVSRETPAAPESAAGVFGSRMPLAEAFVGVLADTGVDHGLIGPREVPRLWERHVLNCAVIHDAFPLGSRVIDVGSGAGLPGLALAIARPDLEVHLVEPMLRRTHWLESAVRALRDRQAFANATVHRGRAEDLVGVISAPWITARAVARTAKLARWCVPLMSRQASGSSDHVGTLIAIKGRSATAELEEDRRSLQRLGLLSARLSEHGLGVLAEPSVTVDLTFRVR